MFKSVAALLMLAVSGCVTSFTAEVPACDAVVEAFDLQQKSQGHEFVGGGQVSPGILAGAYVAPNGDQYVMLLTLPGALFMPTSESPFQFGGACKTDNGEARTYYGTFPNKGNL
jgi:hypothetical protein